MIFFLLILPLTALTYLTSDHTLPPPVPAPPRLFPALPDDTPPYFHSTHEISTTASPVQLVDVETFITVQLDASTQNTLIEDQDQILRRIELLIANEREACLPCMQARKQLDEDLKMLLATMRETASTRCEPSQPLPQQQLVSTTLQPSQTKTSSTPQPPQSDAHIPSFELPCDGDECSKLHKQIVEVFVDQVADAPVYGFEDDIVPEVPCKECGVFGRQFPNGFATIKPNVNNNYATFAPIVMSAQEDEHDIIAQLSALTFDD